MTTLKMSPVWGVSFLSILLLTGGCSGSSGSGQQAQQDSASPQRTSQVCGGLLGRPGATALTGLALSSKAKPAGPSEGEKLKKVAAAMKASPGSPQDQLSSICSFTTPPKEDDGVNLNVQFGWSDLPAKQKKNYLNYTAGSSFIELGFGINEAVPEAGMSNIYFMCQVAGHERHTVKGTYRGMWHVPSGLSPEEKDVQRSRVLLSAASRMSKELQCTNKPDLSPRTEIKPMPSNDLPGDAPRPRWPKLPDSPAA